MFNKIECEVTVDPGAQTTIICDEVFNKLLQSKTNFVPQNGFIQQALGNAQVKTALIAKIEVETFGEKITMNVFYFPGQTTKKCLLGLDFLVPAKVQIDLEHGLAKTSEQGQNYPLFGTAINRIEMIDENGKTEIFGSEEQPPEIADYKLETQPAKEAEQTEMTTEMNKLLEKYAKIFEPKGEATDLATHTIDCKEQAIKTNHYRVAAKYQPEVKRQIQEMLEDDIIEPCEGPFTFPLVVVKKKNGKLRLCVDYKELNKKTTSDKYPLPPMHELLRDVQPGKAISIIDLQAGYWQVPVDPKDQDKTGFSAPGGFYRFKRMPFGLKNAPATFQRMMDRVRQMVPHVRCFAYLDDLIITSPNMEQHVSDLEDIFKIFMKHKLRANKEKCRFGVKEVHYLGHIISENGIATDPDKTKAIKEIKAPKDISGVRRITQTFAWFRRFVPNMAKVLEPITNLTKKNVKFQWKNEQENAMQSAIKMITEAPVLKIPDLNENFTLVTDASNYAIGAVLAQGEQQPVEYASRLLTKAERNYSATEREALAVIWALQKFRGYVEALETTVFTDHQALRWVLSKNAPEGRLARWALALQQYDLVIKYLPGCRNHLADLLSRPREEETTINLKTIECFEASFNITSDLQEIRTKQILDPELKQIIHALEDPETNMVIVSNYSNKGYFLSRGILYKYPPDEVEAEPQLVVPKNMVEETIKINHDHPLAGHGGSHRTLLRIRSRYFWRTMLKDVETYVKSCLECQRFKPKNQISKNALITRPLTRRFETLSVDLVGPLPKSKEGYTVILVVKDPATRWVELIPLETGTAENCATALTNEVFFRYGVPRNVISDNGTQFISSLMQCLSLAMGFEQIVTPVAHPQANPVERKNRDLKTMIAIQVCGNHRDWPQRLPAARFALNSSVCKSTGYTPAYLVFGTDIRSPQHVIHDVRPIIESANIIPELIPELKRMNETIRIIQDYESGKETKICNDKTLPTFQKGDLVLLKTHLLSKASEGTCAKLQPKRDGPYKIIECTGGNTYKLQDKNGEDRGLHSAVDLDMYISRNDEDPWPEPVRPVRKPGRPKKANPEGSKPQRKRGRPPLNKDREIKRRRN